MRSAQIILALLILAGTIFPAEGATFGLRTKEQCDQDPTIVRPSQMMSCYRSAAITMAFMETDASKGEAINICRDIFDMFASSQPTTNKQSDLIAEASLKSNECFATIAVATRDPSICEKILPPQGAVSTGFTGEAVSRDACNASASNLANLIPENYYGDKRNSNLCMMAFILPLVLVPVLIIRK